MWGHHGPSSYKLITPKNASSTMMKLQLCLPTNRDFVKEGPTCKSLLIPLPGSSRYSRDISRESQSFTVWLKVNLDPRSARSARRQRTYSYSCLVVEPYPSEKYDFVSWDYSSQNIWKNKKMFQTTNQIVILGMVCYNWVYHIEPN